MLLTKNFGRLPHSALKNNLQNISRVFDSKDNTNVLDGFSICSTHQQRLSLNRNCNLIFPQHKKHIRVSKVTHL
jgi:hypothetical protein